jgi:hypothetical protein
MSNAKVQSIEAIQGFTDFLKTFRQSLSKELEALDLELRRVTGWVHEEAPNYWLQEQQTNARKLEEQLQQLSRCMSYVRKDEQKPCTEEKKRVAKSKERAQLCDSKIRLSKAASIHWESRTSKIVTKLRRCQDLAEADMQVAIGHLSRHLELLESYTRIRSDGLRSADLQSTSHRDEQITQLPAETTSLTEDSSAPESPNRQQQGSAGAPGGSDRADTTERLP